MLHIRTLGPFAVEIDGQALPPDAWKTQKNRTLCQILLTFRQRPPTREQLQEWLWPNLPPERADRSLRVAVSQLRRTLEPNLPPRATSAYIHSTPGGYTWRLDGAYELDAETFELACATLLRPGGEDVPTAARIRQAEEADALYRDDFLAEERYADWAVVERERLREQYLSLLARLADWQCSQQQFEPAVACYRKILARDACRESIWRALMRVYVQTGARSQALVAFSECSRALAQELEVEPSAETVRLYEQLRGGHARPGGPGAVRHNLPAPLTEFVGRQAEMQALRQHLDDGPARFVTVTGPGGIGKSRLAVEVARSLESFARVVYISLESLTAAGQAVSALADLLGVQPAAGGPLEEALRVALSGQKTLLLLDGCEHLPDAGEAVQALLAHSPGTKALCTSQARLAALGELVIPLAPLAIGPAQEAQALFLAAARRAVPGFAAGPEDQPQIQRICALLDGLPLALELAGAWVRALSLAELAEELASNPDFLQGDSSGRPPRQRSLRATFDYAWGLLSSREQALLSRLAVFQAAFSRQAAQAVAGALLSDLVNLADRSFALSLGRGTFRLHPQVRHFAREKLQAAGVEAAVAQGHARFFLGWLAEQREPLRRGEQGAAIDRIRQALADVQTAWAWASDAAEWALLAGAGESLYRFHDATGRFAEGMELLAGALVAVDGAGQPLDGERLRGALLAWQGALAHRIGQFPRAAAHLQQALALLAQEAGLRSFALNQMGLVHFLQGAPASAQSFFQESLTLCRQADDAYATAVTLNYLGLNATAQGDFSQALLYYEESMRLKATLGDERGIAATLINLGIVVRELGNDFEAQELLAQALDGYRRLGNRRGQAMALLELARVYRLIGDAAEAGGYIRQALAAALEVNALPVALDSLAEAGLHLLETGQEATGARLLLFAQGHPALSGSSRQALAATLRRLAADGEMRLALQQAEVALHRSPARPTLRQMAAELLSPGAG